MAAATTVGAVGVGGSPEPVAAPVPSTTDATAPAPALRSAPAAELVVSRSFERPAPAKPLRFSAAVATAPDRTPKPAEPPDTEVSSAQIVDHDFLTADLNVWSGPGESYILVDVLPSGSRVAVTGEVADGQWAEIAYEGLSRWVNATYLVDEKPQPEAPPEPQPEAPPEPQPEAPPEPQPEAPPEPQPEPQPDPEPPAAPTGLSSAPCASGSEVESGLMPNAIAVHRAVCAAFPSITSYGGVRPDDGSHGQGLGLDIMVTGATGDQVAEFVRAHSGALGVSEVLWAQQIWTVQRSSEGWRPFADRGSVTANHFDHVHVTVYG